MNLPTYATLIIAAAFATANGAETKQHVRKAQGDVAEKLTEAIEETFIPGWPDFDKYNPAPSCGAGNFNTGVLTQVGEICTIVPDQPNQSGAPQGTVNGIFCTDDPGNPLGPYTLEFTPVSPTGRRLSPGYSGSRLLRIDFQLGTVLQNPAPNGDRRLSPLAPLLDPAVNGGSGAPVDGIMFQGTWNPDCSFRAVSTQGGELTGTLDFQNGHTSVDVEFTQSGQVTNYLNTLGGQFTNVVGLLVSSFAFAFQGEFSDDF